MAHKYEESQVTTLFRILEDRHSVNRKHPHTILRIWEIFRPGVGTRLKFDTYVGIVEEVPCHNGQDYDYTIENPNADTLFMAQFRLPFAVVDFIRAKFNVKVVEVDTETHEGPQQVWSINGPLQIMKDMCTGDNMKLMRRMTTPVPQSVTLEKKNGTLWRAYENVRRHRKKPIAERCMESIFAVFKDNEFRDTPASAFLPLYSSYSKKLIYRCKKKMDILSYRMGGEWVWASKNLKRADLVMKKERAKIDAGVAHIVREREDSESTRMLRALCTVHPYAFVRSEIVDQLPYQKVTLQLAKRRIGIVHRKVDGIWMWLYPMAPEVREWLVRFLSFGDAPVQHILHVAREKGWINELVLLVKSKMGNIRVRIEGEISYWCDINAVNIRGPLMDRDAEPEIIKLSAFDNVRDLDHEEIRNIDEQFCPVCFEEQCICGEKGLMCWNCRFTPCRCRRHI